MADPKSKSGGSKKFQDASDELRIHMAIKVGVGRLIELVNKQDELVNKQDMVTSSIREEIDRLNVNLAKQGEKFMTRVEEAAPLTTPPPTRPSMRPTQLHAAMTPDAFRAGVLERFEKATTDSERQMVRDGLRRSMEQVPEFGRDMSLRQLEAELARR